MSNHVIIYDQNKNQTLIYRYANMLYNNIVGHTPTYHHLNISSKILYKLATFQPPLQRCMIVASLLSYLCDFEWRIVGARPEHATKTCIQCFNNSQLGYESILNGRRQIRFVGGRVAGSTAVNKNKTTSSQALLAFRSS